MPDSLVWGRALVAAMSALPPESTAVALVRHAEREPIPSFQENDAAALTRQGEADAYQVGRHLPVGRPIRLFHSPIGRCQMTAVRIAEGFRSVGGSAEVLGCAPLFGGPYVVDAEEISHLLAGMGDHFVRAWFDGEIPSTAILPPQDAARQQWHAMRGVAREAPAGSLTLVCTHDWNIMLVRETYLGVRHEEHGWAEFLDGPLLVLHDGECHLTWRDRAIPMPLFAPASDRAHTA